MRVPVSFRVNGEDCELTIQPRQTLLEVLREELGLTGTKCSCNLGHCGVCTVLMDGKPVLSCSVLGVEAQGSEILTIEGLARDGQLHPLQQAFVEHGAIQCGFCTPGMILSAKALLDVNPDPTEEEVRLAISGNLCRCTGYAKPVAAILSAARVMREGGGEHGRA